MPISHKQNSVNRNKLKHFTVFVNVESLATEYCKRHV